MLARPRWGSAVIQGFIEIYLLSCDSATAPIGRGQSNSRSYVWRPPRVMKVSAQDFS